MDMDNDEYMTLYNRLKNLKINSKIIETDAFQYRAWCLNEHDEIETSWEGQKLIRIGEKEDILSLIDRSDKDGFIDYSKNCSDIMKNYYWPGMYNEIVVYLANKIEGPKVVSNNKFGEIAIDLVGPFKKSKDNNTFIVVVTDMYTQWVEAFAIKNDLAQTVGLKIFSEVVCRYGRFSQVVHSFDEDYIFEILVLNDLLEAYSIFINEIYNKEVCKDLEEFVKISYTKDDWDLFFHKFLSKNRRSENSRSKTIPALSLLNYIPRSGDTSINTRLVRQKINQVSSDFNDKLYDSLEPKEWFHSDVIDKWLKILKANSNYAFISSSSLYAISCSPLRKRTWLNELLREGEKEILTVANIKGNHWIGIHIVPRETIAYYDPLGLIRTDFIINVKNWLDPSNEYNIYQYSDFLIQNDSYSCGPYVCFWLETFVTLRPKEGFDPERYRIFMKDVFQGKIKLGEL